MVSVIERLNTLLSLSLAYFCGVKSFEESWSQFNEPLGIYDDNLTHVLLSSHRKFMVDDPVGLSLGKSTAGMYVDSLILHQSFITFLWILPGCMEEEASSYGFPYLCKVFPSTHYIQFVSAC